MKFEFKNYCFLYFFSKILIFYFIFFGLDLAKSNKSYAESLREIEMREYIKEKEKNNRFNCKSLYKNAEWEGNVNLEANYPVAKYRYFRKSNKLYEVTDSKNCYVRSIPLNKKINNGGCNWLKLGIFDDWDAGFSQFEISIEAGTLFRRGRRKYCRWGRGWTKVQRQIIPRIRKQYLP